MAWVETTTIFERTDGVKIERFLDDDGYSNFLLYNIDGSVNCSLMPGDSWPNYPSCTGDAFEADLFAWAATIIPEI